MLKFIEEMLARKKICRHGSPEAPRLILTESSLRALRLCLEPEIQSGKEGVAYFLGQSDGSTTLVASVIRPQAKTTENSFSVGLPEMARVVRTTVDFGLQVVGQAHTHPKEAYHSDGDEEGARIAYTGYVSIVNSGLWYPTARVGWHSRSFMFQPAVGFVPVMPDQITILPEYIS